MLEVSLQQRHPQTVLFSPSCAHMPLHAHAPHTLCSNTLPGLPPARGAHSRYVPPEVHMPHAAPVCSSCMLPPSNSRHAP
eukprot:1158392-Pelagomonas_calceolata.AAC.10